MQGRENIEVAEERHGDINHVINNIYIHEMFLLPCVIFANQLII